MPRRYEMGTLVERCKRRADKENDDHISPAEWKALISEVYATDVYSPVAEVGLRYFEYTSSLVTTGAAYVSEPTDHFGSIRLDYILNTTTGEKRELVEIMAPEEAWFAGRSGSEARYFALIDDRVYLYPTPPTGQTYEMRYCPQPPDLSAYADTDLVDVVTPDGEAALVWGVAALALAKAKQDASFHASQQEKYRDRHHYWASQRMLSQPARRVVTNIDPSLIDLDPGSRWWP